MAKQNTGKKPSFIGKIFKWIGRLILLLLVLLVVAVAVLMVLDHFGIISPEDFQKSNGRMMEVELHGEVLDDESYTVAAVDADEYFANHAQIIKEIEAKDSENLQSGKEVRKLLSERGFSDCVLTAVYSQEGDLEPENEVTEKTSEKYPMYQAYYKSAKGDLWLIYSINSALMAVPFLSDMQAHEGAELIVSESNTVVSYDNVKNKFYETIPNSTEINVKTVDSITADVLDYLTTEALG